MTVITYHLIDSITKEYSWLNIQKQRREIHIWEVVLESLNSLTKNIYIVERYAVKMERRNAKNFLYPTIFEHAKEIWIEKVNTEQKYQFVSFISNIFFLFRRFFCVTERKAKRRHQRIVKLFFWEEEGAKGRGREHFRFKNVNHYDQYDEDIGICYF